MKEFGLIGKNLSHSFSRKYFTERFTEKGIQAEYLLLPLEDIRDFTALLQRRPLLAGLNVTIPYKEEIIPLLNELDETARAVNAVNCIEIFRNGDRITTIGHNTDVFGFKQSIKPFLESHHDKALILGTGGASKAVLYVLKNMGIDCFFVSRTLKASPNSLTYDMVNSHVLSACKLVVNTTPKGMFPETGSCPDIPFEELGPDHLVYDLIYNPDETLFLKKAKQQGAKTLNGLSMLHLQAEKSAQIWSV